MTLLVGTMLIVVIILISVYSVVPSCYFLLVLLLYGILLYIILPAVLIILAYISNEPSITVCLRGMGTGVVVDGGSVTIVLVALETG